MGLASQAGLSSPFVRAPHIGPFLCWVWERRHVVTFFLKKQEELADTSPIAVNDASPIVADDTSPDNSSLNQKLIFNPFLTKNTQKKNTLEAVINLSIASKNPKKSSENLK